MPFRKHIRKAVFSTYPIDFIQIIRFENEGADDSLSRSGFHGDGDFTEKHVEIALNGRCVTPLVDGELGTIGARWDGACNGLPLIQA